MEAIVASAALFHCSRSGQGVAFASKQLLVDCAIDVRMRSGDDLSEADIRSIRSLARALVSTKCDPPYSLQDLFEVLHMLGQPIISDRQVRYLELHVSRALNNLENPRPAAAVAGALVGTMGMAASDGLVLADVQKSLKQTSKRESYWKSRRRRLEKQVLELQKRIRSNDYIVQNKKTPNKSKSKCVVSLQGGYTLALRRNMGHCSAAATALMLEVPVQRQTIINWECNLGANIIGKAQRWHECNRRLMERWADAMNAADPEGADLFRKVLNFSHEVEAVLIKGRGNLSLLWHRLHNFQSLLTQRYAFMLRTTVFVIVFLALCQVSSVAAVHSCFGRSRVVMSR